jgi:hypothetical protein
VLKFELNRSKTMLGNKYQHENDPRKTKIERKSKFAPSRFLCSPPRPQHISRNSKAVRACFLSLWLRVLFAYV